MASRREILDLELSTITEEIHCMNSMLKPLTSLDANTHDDLHAKLHKFNPAENRLLSYLSKRHADDNFVKPTLMWKPIGDDVREEPEDFRVFGTAEDFAQPGRKSSTTTDLYKKALYGEKENLEYGPDRARGSFSSSNPKISAGISGLTPVLEESKGFNSQKNPRLEDFLCFVSDSSIQTPITESRGGAQPLTVLVHEKMKETSFDLCSHSIQTKKAPLLRQFHGRSEQESLGGSVTQRSGLANSLLLSHQENPPKQGKSTQNYAENRGHVWRQSIKTAKTPLLGQSKAQGMEENSCSLLRPELLKTSVLSQSESQSIQHIQTCEEISTQNNDHVVILFSVQKTVKGSAARKSRQELLKLSSLCMQYSRKILSWISSLCRKQNIRCSLRRLQQIFSYSSPGGFVDLNSQKLPEFSPKKSSLSAKRKLAKDNELKAVLLKINEVLASMDRTLPDDSKADYR